jgi:hypothetical protein
MINSNSNNISPSTDNNIIQITTQGGNVVNVTQPVTSIIEVKAQGPAGPIGPKGDPGDGFPFIPDFANQGIAQITGSLQVSGGVIFRGRGNSNIYTDTFNVGYYVTTDRPVTGSGLVISSSNLPPNNHNFLKIGNSELVDININGDKDFIIHVPIGLQVSTGEDIGGLGTLFKHNGDEFEVDISGSPKFYIDDQSVRVVNSSLTASSISSNNIVTTDLTVSNTINGFIQNSFNSFTSDLSDTTQNVRLLGVEENSFAYPFILVNNREINLNNDYPLFTPLNTSSLTFIPSTNTLQVSGSQIISGTLSIDGAIINGLTISGTLQTQPNNSILFPGLSISSKSHVVVYDTNDGKLYITASNAFGGSGSVSPRPGGADLSIQFNNYDSLEGSEKFIFNNSTDQVLLTGSLLVSGGISATNTITANNGFIGDLTGTSSWATNATNAQSASYILNAISSSFASTASFVLNAQTASYVLNAVSSSFASTASFVRNAISASYVQNAQTASYVLNAISASYVLNAVSASYVQNSQTASYVLNAQSASYVQNAQSASYILNAVSSSFAITASHAISANTATSATTLNLSSTTANTNYRLVLAVAPGGSQTLFTDSEPASMTWNASTNRLNVSGAISASAVTSSLLGTASFATTASHALNGGVTKIIAGPNITISPTNGLGEVIISASSLTGSLFGTASWAINALTASFINPLTQSVFVSGNLIITGSLNSTGEIYLKNLPNESNNYVVLYDNNTGKLTYTASTAFGGGGSSGSGTPGGSDTQIQFNDGGVFGGSPKLIFDKNNELLTLTGSLLVNGNIITTNTITANNGFTGNLTGTSSWASNATNAVTASYVQNSQTASYVLNAISSSYAATASTINTSNLEIPGTILASGLISGDSLSITNGATIYGGITGSLFGTSSWAANATNATTASYILNAVSSSFASTASFVRNAISASYVLNAVSASYVLNAQSASYVQNAQSASYVQNAQSASYILNAVSSSFATTASHALNGGVTKIIAGPNITISPTSGLGEVAISASSVGGFTPSLSTDLVAKNITASANISASGDLSIRGFSSVSASIAALSLGIGTLAQVTALGATTTTPITASIISASSFTGSLFGTASWAINARTASFINNLNQNIIITGSLTQGLNNLSSGTNSHTEGFRTTASAIYSHAEGNSTLASGNYSHAEGSSTQALGIASHAEGQSTVATGVGSHAEGQNSTAEGSAAHAEGVSTQAKGAGSHAEGQSTIASGSYSHAEGLGTIARADHQSVVGSYNIEDSNSTTKFIIGGGLNSSQRANIASFSTTQIIFSQSLSIPGIPNVSASIALASQTGVSGGTFPYNGNAVITGSLLISGAVGLRVSGNISQSNGNVFLRGLINQTTPQSHVVTFNNTTGQLFITASNAFGGMGPGSSTPAGNPGTIQYNNAGALGGSSRFSMNDNGSAVNVTLTGSITATQAINADEFNLTGTGVPTIVSDTNLNLSASNAVVIQSPVLRLKSTTTSSVITPSNGDIIYDSNQHKFFGYANGVWVAFH